VGTVSSTESIVDEDITELGKRSSELFNIFLRSGNFVTVLVLGLTFFFKVETSVFKKENGTISWVSTSSFNFSTNTVI
jgi:hypothetical protein